MNKLSAIVGAAALTLGLQACSPPEVTTINWYESQGHPLYGNTTLTTFTRQAGKGSKGDPHFTAILKSPLIAPYTLAKLMDNDGDGDYDSVSIYPSPELLKISNIRMSVTFEPGGEKFYQVRDKVITALKARDKELKRVFQSFLTRD